jgi:transcriptional regulator with XRE-family HTH domain
MLLDERTSVADPAADIRAELGRRQMKRYELASLIRMHPAHLGKILNGRLPLSEALLRRIMDALKLSQ